MLEQIYKIIERVSPGFKQKLENKNPRLVLVGLTLLFALPATYFVTSWYFKKFQISPLNITISGLKSKLQDIQNENNNLTEQLIPYKTTALQYYPGPESNAMAKLADRINKIDLSMLSLLDYQEVSTWDIFGKVTKMTGNALGLSSPGSAAGWTIGFFKVDQSGKIKNLKCDAEAIKHYTDIIKKYSLYPFPYYIISECLKNNQDPQWKTYRETSLELVRKTTKIPNHNQDHDALLNTLEGSPLK